MPRVSVIIPVHDRAEELRETLASVARQTLHDIEVLVIDDRSGPEVAAVVAEQDERFRFARLPYDRRGAPAARNAGVAEATGDFVLFLDSDDLLDATCLERRVATLDNAPSLDFAVWPCRMFRKADGDLPLFWNRLDRDEADVGDDLDRFLRLDVVWQTASPLWRREALDKVGPWDEAATSRQDWEFHVRALLLGLEYEKMADPAEADHAWRIAGARRRSIGGEAWRHREYAVEWSQTLDKIIDFFHQHGPLAPKHRTALAALIFRVAIELDSKHDGREARAFWRTAFARDLCSRRQMLEGQAYLLARRKSLELALKIENRLARRWHPDFFAPDTRYLNVYRPDGSPPPRVSFAMPAKDVELWIEEATWSCLRQTMRDLEVVAVNDGSVDATGEILDRIARRDSRLRVIHRPRGKPEGLAQSIIDSVAACRADVILRMDADDVSMPRRAELQLKAFENRPDLVLVGGGANYIDPYGFELGVADTPDDHDTLDQHHLRGKGGVILHPAAAMRRDALEQAGGYRTKFDTAEDVDLFLRLAEVGRIGNIEERVVSYRLHPKSVSHARREEQVGRVLGIVAEARERRGLPAITEDQIETSLPKPAAEQLNQWGWMAMKRNDLRAARGFAGRLLREKPLSKQSWRLAYCALRGR
jgi:glycosyltransferase involved in cell wall biosynthesis